MLEVGNLGFERGFEISNLRFQIRIRWGAGIAAPGMVGGWTFEIREGI
jgi:hypothetical protein